jgi:hypothetical protein
MEKRELSDLRKDYSEERLYPDQKLRDEWKKKAPVGSIYTDSELGGDSLSLQNPWQGSQDKAKGEEP